MNKRTVNDIEKWMTYYYQNPQPELTPQLLEANYILSFYLSMCQNSLERQNLYKS